MSRKGFVVIYLRGERYKLTKTLYILEREHCPAQFDPVRFSSHSVLPMQLRALQCCSTKARWKHSVPSREVNLYSTVLSVGCF